MIFITDFYFKVCPLVVLVNTQVIVYIFNADTLHKTCKDLSSNLRFNLFKIQLLFGR